METTRFQALIEKIRVEGSVPLASGACAGRIAQLRAKHTTTAGEYRRHWTLIARYDACSIAT
jgi:hypothetical protein